MLRKIHRWIGLILVLPFALQGLTGTLLILIPLLMPGRPQVRPAGPPAMNTLTGVEAMIAAARTAAPQEMIPLRFDPARWAGDSAVVTFGPPGERHPTFEVLMDPGGPSVIRTHVFPAFFRFLHNLHADLFLLPYGQTATGVMGLLLSGMAITGLILWWPHPALWASGKWRRTVTISSRARGLRLWREAHVSIGFWASAMLLFLALSGSILAFPFARPLFGIQRPDQGPRHGEHHSPMENVPGEKGLDAALQALHFHMPDASLLDVRLGASPRQQSLEVALPAYGLNRPATVQYNPHDDSLRITRDPGQQRTGEWTFQWLHTLHEAKLAAPAVIAPLWKAVVFVTGAALVFFSVSGFVMWSLRRRDSARRSARVSATLTERLSEAD
ncbi:PepSY domain-containing protein [Acetobacter fallax]|uniref:PepSY domain-containing protein n=1 Tax=Acetobacter fallax TaxID=1737473 RepID=A0ABX0K3V5_9PROT|nr:PepSY domain-containing protein [Acetobacter fallax]NHO34563.1 PepSY domain-containing protein [Acetobacter fallax]